MTIAHHCHAVGCNKRVAPKLLMCAAHWRRVPAKWKELVWRTYRAGQEVTKTPSKPYLFVQGVVVAQVAFFDGTWTKERADEHIRARGALVFRYLDPAWVKALPGVWQ